MYNVARNGQQPSVKERAHSKGKNQTNYGYTGQRNATPLRDAMPGANNVPMSYSGPPTEQERHRNRHRNDQTRSSITMNGQQNYTSGNYD